MTRLLALRIPARANELKGLRDRVRSSLADACLTDKDIEDTIIAINEAAINIIQHAYGDDLDGDIELEIHNNQGELVISLRDYAPTSDSTHFKPRELDDIRPGGLGTHFMRQLMDTLHYSVPADGVGNQLEMRIKINGT